MSSYNCFLKKDKLNEDKLHNNRLISILMPSFLGILLCAVCICGMTWAWFSESVESSSQKLTAAYYDVTVKSIENEAGTVDFADSGYYLKSNNTYTVTLQASGTVKECGGYCLIKNEAGEVTYTQTFKPEESITIQFTPNTDGYYIFTGVWGSLPIGTTDYLTHTEKNAVSSPEEITKATADNNSRVTAAAEQSTAPHEAEASAKDKFNSFDTDSADFSTTEPTTQIVSESNNHTEEQITEPNSDNTDKSAFNNSSVPDSNV